MNIKFREYVNGKFHYWGFVEEGIFKGPVTPSLTRGHHSRFTGLKDKHGEEIYEGDIVIQEKWVSVGKYVPAKGVVKYKGVGFTCECIGDWSGSNADLNGNSTVIGNIYENPELLTKEENT